MLTDDGLVAKYGVQPEPVRRLRHACAATPPTGCRVSPGVGEKTAATCCSEYGDLDGILAAAADPASAMTAGQREKFVAAADYLAVAPEVVEVVRDLPLPTFDASIGVPDPAAARALAEKWGLSSSMERAIAALGG